MKQHALLLSLILLAGALGCDQHEHGCGGCGHGCGFACEEEDSYSEIHIDTDECGITEVTECDGATKQIEENGELTSSFEKCAGLAPAMHKPAYGVPLAPDVSATSDCERNVKLTWTAVEDSYIMELYEKDGPRVRLVTNRAADMLQEGGVIKFQFKALAVGEYRARVSASNVFGRGPHASSQVISITSPLPPRKPLVSAWLLEGKVSVLGQSLDATMCSKPTSWIVKAYAANDEAAATITSESSTVEFHTSSDPLAHNKNMLKNGQTYSFTATAVNAAGKTTSAKSSPVTAQNRPLTPRVPNCNDGSFGCKVSNNCTGGVRFTWPPTSPPGGNQMTYIVRAFLQTQAAHVQEWAVQTEMFDVQDMSWAIGEAVSFSVQSIDSKTSWQSDWSKRTPTVLMPGVPSLPTLSFAQKVDSVVVSWDPGAVRWVGDEQIKRFKLEGNSLRGSVVRELCMVRACASLANAQSAVVETPLYCANKQCGTFTIENSPAIKSGKRTANGGVRFTLKAESRYHSNCANTHAVEEPVYPVTPPEPPQYVQAHSTYGSGSLTTRFPPSKGFEDAPILRYTITVTNAERQVLKSAVLQVPQRNSNSAGAVVVDGAVGDSAWLEYVFPAGLDTNVEYYIEVKALNMIGSSTSTRSSSTVVIAPVDADPVMLVDEALAGEIKSTIVTMQFILPGVAPEEVTPEVRTAYVEAVAETMGLLPAYVRVTNVTQVACDNRDCTTISNVESVRRLASSESGLDSDSDSRNNQRNNQRKLPAITASVIHTKAVIPITNVQSEQQATAVGEYANTDAMIDGMTSRLKASNSISSHFYKSMFVHGVHVSHSGSGSTLSSSNTGGSSGGVFGDDHYYPMVFLTIGITVTVFGVLLALIAQQRINSSSQSDVEVKSTQLARKPGKEDSFWSRAAIRSPLQASDIKQETSFFESDLDDEAPADFINPAMTLGNDMHSPSKLSGGGGGSTSHLGARRSQQGGSVMGARRSELGRGSSKSHLGARRSGTAAQQVSEQDALGGPASPQADVQNALAPISD